LQAGEEGQGALYLVGDVCGMLSTALSNCIS